MPHEKRILSEKEFIELVKEMYLKAGSLLNEEEIEDDIKKGLDLAYSRKNDSFSLFF